ncbi:MAG: biopolymer transporter ExbD [Nitrospirales bacterium]|nr:biopolymer transporter ExbD [Nitrospirales bacterium]
MKLPRAQQKRARIEIIPMIDTMFFLLVFFMLATLSMTWQKGIAVNLPTAVSSTQNVTEELVLSLTKTGELFLNKESILFPELQTRVINWLTMHPNSAVIINADTEVAHGRVIALMDNIRQAGITKMAIATKPRTFSDSPSRP